MIKQTKPKPNTFRIPLMIEVKAADQQAADRIACQIVNHGKKLVSEDFVDWWLDDVLHR